MKKKLMYVIVSSIIALFILGTSFSIYTYNKIGGKQGQVVLGNIYMSANEKSITLNEIRPMDINEGLTNGSKYQFSVEGYNTSSKNIYYGVYINYGDEISTKSRFKDEDIMMYLTETKNGETREVYGPGSLKDFNDKLIYASTIDAAIKKEEKVDIDYELTVWLSDKILISDTVQEYEGKNIYTTEEYENSYASISVKVEGDFEEKNIQTGEESIAATLV